MPVFAVPVGSRTRLPDVELLEPRRCRPSASPASRCASRSRSTARCRASTCTTVTLETSDGDEVTKEVRIAADEPHQRLADLEAEEQRATSRVTLDGPQARRRDAARQQQADAPRSRSARRSCGCWWSSRIRGGSIATCAMPCRATRASSFRACCSTRAEQARRRQQGLHQAVSRPGCDELSKYDVVFLGDVGLGRRPVDGRAVPAAQGAGRAPGQRAGVHAGHAGARALAAGYRAGRPLPGGAGLDPAGRLGLADRRTISS